MRSEHEWISRLVCSLYILGIVIVSLLPRNLLLSGTVPHLDKVGHLIAYTGLGFLIGMSFRRGNGRLLMTLFAIGLGFLLEWGQSFIPGREMSLADGIVNTFGVLLGLIFWRQWGGFFSRWLYHRLG